MRAASTAVAELKALGGCKNKYTGLEENGEAMETVSSEMVFLKDKGTSRPTQTRNDISRDWREGVPCKKII